MEQLAIDSLGELPKAAEAVITASGGRGVVAFFGAMGAGKTTLIREICTQLGVADNVTSPTFALVNHYRSGRGDNIFHFDFYRIEKLDEAYDLGYDEYFDSGALCLVGCPNEVAPKVFNRLLYTAIAAMVVVALVCATPVILIGA